jgi:hypothetical protein
MIVALLFAAATPNADDALRRVEIQTAATREKQERALEAVEKAVRVAPAPVRCPRCPACDTAWVEMPSPIVASAPVSQPSTMTAPPRPTVPLWVWIVGTAILATATGAAITGAAMSAR